MTYNINNIILYKPFSMLQCIGRVNIGRMHRPGRDRSKQRYLHYEYTNSLFSTPAPGNHSAFNTFTIPTSRCRRTYRMPKHFLKCGRSAPSAHQHTTNTNTPQPDQYVYFSPPASPTHFTLSLHTNTPTHFSTKA